MTLTAHPDLPVNLALAVVATSTAPLLLLDGELNLIAASTSFCHAFQIDPITIPGLAIAALGAGEWNSPQLIALLTATAAGYAEVIDYEMDLLRKDHEDLRLVINVHKLDYGAGQSVRLLVSVADITAARAAERVKAEMLKEKAVLLQEIQHRVANSLQIIASVLMQSARKVQSEETRSHLYDAHQRVMSVAALQHQLAASQLGTEVELKPYLTALCGGIGASMIRDHATMTLTVRADDSIRSADASVSLGLIVTELVINALKHAFPDERAGAIIVDFQSKGPDWSLSVSDNGVGMPTQAAAAKPGLGTGIVNALSKQLHAVITITDAKPGTTVLIAHKQSNMVSSKSATVS